MLQAAGLNVTAVQNPLSLLQFRRCTSARWPCRMDRRCGRHLGLYTVISEIGTDPKVTCLVDAAARAPERTRISSLLSEQFSNRSRWRRLVGARWLHKLSEERS